MFQYIYAQIASVNSERIFDCDCIIFNIATAKKNISLTAGNNV